ncbi:MAG: hypothetical protein V4760_06120 [Bdellovibrionota bacterium]
MPLKSTLRRDLRFSSLDALFSSVMVGAGETFLPAFALALGLGEVTAGTIAAFPFLLGSMIQLAAPWLISRLGSYRRWLVPLGALQGLMFVPLALVGATGYAMSSVELMIVVTIYWTCGLASGPAWSSWMTGLVPQKIRPKYFAARSHLGQFGLLGGLVGGGLLLDAAKGLRSELMAFAFVFTISAIFRLASAYCLARKSEAKGAVHVQRRVPLRDIVHRLRHGNDGRFIGFLLFFGVAVNFSSPFFNPYMLKRLELSYTAYMGLIAVSFVAKIIVFHAASKISHRFNALAFMRAGIIGICFLPVVWVFSSNYLYLAVMQVFSGALWAVYDLGMTLALFGTIRDEERTSFMSYFNFASAAMMMLGTTAGGHMFQLFGESTQTYFIIFSLGTVFRFMALMVFDRVNALAKHRVPSSRYEVALPLLREAGRSGTHLVSEMRHVTKRLPRIGRG